MGIARGSRPKVSMIAIGFHFHAPMIASDGLRVYAVGSVGLVLLCAMAQPTQYACFDIRRNLVIKLGFWPRTNSVEAWLTEWRERTRLACPEISRTIA
jgi:hypothetical protein